MSQNSISINEHIHAVLMKDSFNDFTVTQFRDNYMAQLTQPADAVTSREIVYRQVLRFLKLGLLQKKEANNVRKSTYSKTPEFFKSHFRVRSTKLSALSTDNAPRIKNSAMKSIEAQLKQYKVDLLASVGESEEYMRLYHSNPELKQMLEPEYLQARDQSSRLLGQIKALNTVLSHYSR